MRRWTCLLLLCGLVVGCDSGPDDVEYYTGGEAEAPVAGDRTFTMEGMTSEVPPSWIRKTGNRMRYADFVLPGPDGSASLVVYNQFKGSADQNMDRWKKEMQPPAGKTLDEIARITDITVGPLKGKRLDAIGTYTSAMANSPGPKKDWQMIGIHLDGEKTWHFKLTGPRTTVEQHLAGFNKWLSSFE